MHLNQIKSFITVSQVLNFTNAARQNGVPQSTISRQINDLEQQLGVAFLPHETGRSPDSGGACVFTICAGDPGCREKGAFAVRQRRMRVQRDGFLSLRIDDSDQFLAMCLQEFSRKYPGLS